MIQPYNRSFRDYGSGIDVGKNGTVYPRHFPHLDPCVPGDVATIFATQLDGTKQNGLVRQCWHECVLRPKILIERHAIELGGMAADEFQDRCLKPLGHPSILAGSDI
jgi:hypothetical protein